MPSVSVSKNIQPELAMPTKARPFLKWAGGKFRVLDEILPRLPVGKRLIEPFAGSAAVAINAGYEKALVSDLNPHLIELYEAVRDNASEFIAEGKATFANANTREAFDSLRAEFNTTTDPFRRAVLFVYLNRHGFNGLCRYNGRGKFNVPFGRYKGPKFPEREVLEFSKRTESFEFHCESFEDAMKRATEGDVIYCDPPYVPLSATSNFTSYAKEGFGFPHQKRLAEVARESAQRGIAVLISNHDTADARALYRGAEIQSFAVRRFISSKASTRGNAQELLAIFRPQ